MTPERIVWIEIEGEPHAPLESLAETCAFEVAWLERVVDAGLAGRAVRRESQVLIAARSLDRIVEVRRLERRLGLSLAEIEVWFAGRGPG